MSIVKLMTQGDTIKLIDSIGERAGDLQADIHTAAFNTLDHARVHGDYTGIERLMNKLPTGQRVKALAAWYRGFSTGKVSLSQKSKDSPWAVNKDRFASRVDSDFDMTRAEETTFAEYTVERDPVTLTVEAFLKSLKRTAVNAANFDGTDIPKVAPAARALASRLLAEAEAIRAAAQAEADKAALAA
jgi:hypothetical protein